MPSSVADLLTAAGLQQTGVVAWGEPVPATEPGVYLVSTSADPDLIPPDPVEAPISVEAVDELFEAAPGLLLDGESPSRTEIIDRLASFWLPDEPVLYVGLAETSMRSRVSQYYRTKLGARRPHAGGWFLKTLTILPELWVHFAATGAPKEKESEMIGAFVSSTSAQTRQRLPDPARPFPFANLEWPPRTRKPHGITGARGPGGLSGVASDG